MKPKTPCPPKSVWQHIVGAGFEGYALGELGPHLDRCQACQATVESLMDRERTCRAIAAELRQELPPTAPACRHRVAFLQQSEPTGPIKPEQDPPDPGTDNRLPGERVYCPHCLELVLMVEAVGCAPARCPHCQRAVDAVGEDATLPDYEVDPHADDQPMKRDIRAYVQNLEERARAEEKREPYHRGGFPVGQVAALVCFLAAVGFLISGLTSGYGMFAGFINGILPAFALVMMGAVCYIFRRK